MPARILLLFLDLYQKYLRRTMPSACRFIPSCSDYAREAVQKYGAFWGGLKAIKRLLRCHPLSRRYGYDPLI